ncbi:MAG: PIG-L family deacetylase [Gemmatimonadaceae bacterium]
MRTRSLVLVAALVLAPRILIGQERGAAALGEAVGGLGVSVRVLMIGAHPDDEDTQLITYLAKGRHIETAYLSLTRGDGGQNLIGNELGPLLGMIRTQELLAARRIDGGRQYFTRAYDFGFSKTAAETFKHWPSDSILRDMISVIRAYRPQVVISVWSGTPRDGHGHHQVSGILSREAFDLAGDTVRYPRSTTNGLGAWTPTVFYRSARVFGRGADQPMPGTLPIDVGAYDVLEGRTYAAIAAESRSQHRSQGQGNLAPLEPRLDHVRLEVALPPASSRDSTSLFAGMDTSFARFATLPLPAAARAAVDSLDGARTEIARRLHLVDPWAAVAPIAHFLDLAQRAAAGARGCAATGMPVPVCAGAMGDFATTMDEQVRRAKRALLLAAGVQLLATSPKEVIAIGDRAPITISVVNHGRAPVTYLGRDSSGTYVGPAPQAVAPEALWEQTYEQTMAGEPTMPWWLRYPLAGDMFSLRLPGDLRGTPVPQLLEGEDRVRSSGVRVALEIAGVHFTYEISPIVRRFADPARGEVERPIALAPAITVLFDREVEYARANTALDRREHLVVRSDASHERRVTVTLALPAGLTADSASRTLTLAPGEDANLYFRLRGTLRPGAHAISASATSDGQTFTRGYVPVEYEHIQPQRYYRRAVVELQAVDVNYARGMTIAYIPGVGDNVEPMLAQLGLRVTTVAPDALPETDLSRFAAVVVGARAFDASDALRANNGRLLRYARNGGTLVEQYEQVVRPGQLPYPITLSRPADRVTEEDAPVTILDGASPILNTPNRITTSDFDHWVQERSSYMPHTFDDHYHAILSMHDTGEPPNDAGILVAPLGRGTFVYVTLSFFRQLPAGNPGAARLFVNILSANQRAAVGGRKSARPTP